MKKITKKSPPKKRGRKPIIDEITLSNLKYAFMIGATDQEACVYAEISEATLYRYIEKNPEFGEKKEIWKKKPILQAKDTIISNLGYVDTAKWYLEKKCKDEFGNKIGLEHSGGLTIGNITIT